MLQSQTFGSLCLKSLARQLSFIKTSRTYSSKSADEEDLEAARNWFRTFNKNTIPYSISHTTFSRASGSGGQKVNKYVCMGTLPPFILTFSRTSSKATTVWPLQALQRYVPKVLVPELRSCRFYVSSSDSISIQCDASRGQTDNKEETHRKLLEEIKQIYKKRVPGVTSPEQKAKIDQL
jgi:peptidyl-tRNA hydrolase ICT1